MTSYSDRLDWAQVGQWVKRRLNGEFYVITRTRFGWVYVRRWRDPAEAEFDVDVDFFYEYYTPCAEPSDPKTAWERLTDSPIF